MFLQYGMLFTFTVIHFDFPKHSCTATIAYDIDVGHISTHNFFPYNAGNGFLEGHVALSSPCIV